MSTATIEIKRPPTPERDLDPIGPEPEAGVGAGRGVASRRGRIAPLLAMVAGVAVMALAVAVVLRAADGGRPRAQAASTVAAPVADPFAITLSARDVSVVTQVYEPGADSGWHAHPGIHAVAVLSGVLTVYDNQCHPQTFGPGQPYVGGQQAHLVRNEADTPVVMVVTYLNPSSPTSATEHMPGPAGCVIG